MIWDVGLGAASNAMAAVRCFENVLGNTNGEQTGKAVDDKNDSLAKSFRETQIARESAQNQGNQTSAGNNQLSDQSRKAIAAQNRQIVAGQQKAGQGGAGNLRHLHLISFECDLDH